MAYKIKKKKALPRRKKEDIFPKKEKGLKAKVSRAVTKVKLAGVRRLAKKGKFGPAQPKAVKPSKRKARADSAGRAKKRAKAVSKIKKMQKAGMKVTRVKSVPLKETSPTGRIRKGAKKVLVTKGGAYASYEKGSKAAKNFRSAFKSGCAGGAKSFTWDGRSYSCKKK